MLEAKAITNDLLKSKMTDAMVYRGIATTMNVTRTGYYTVMDGTTADIPSGMYSYGVLKVWNAGNFISQEYHPHENAAIIAQCHVWKRTWFNNNFSPWRQYKYVTT